MKYLILFALFLSVSFFLSNGVTNDINPRVKGSILKARNLDFFKTPIFSAHLVHPKKKNPNNMAIDMIYTNKMYKRNHVMNDLDSLHYYKSAIRIQMYVYSLLDEVIVTITGKYDNLIILNSLYTIMSSFCTFLLLVWVYTELGSATSLFSAFFLALNPLSYSFGSYSYFWILILPLLYSLYLFVKFEYHKGKVLTTKNLIILTILVFFATCTSYEEFPTIAVTTTIPVFYYGIKNSCEFKYFSKYLFFISLSILVGLIFSIILHYFLVADIMNSCNDAYVFFKNKFFLRTYDFNTNSQLNLNLKHNGALDKNLFVILKEFMQEGEGIFNVKEWKWYIASVFSLVAYILLRNFYNLKININTKKLYGLFASVTIAFVSALSRPIVFKGHASLEAHQEFITDSFNVSFKPFVLIFMLYLLYTISNDILSQSEKQRDSKLA